MNSRKQKAEALEKWADEVPFEELEPADTSKLQAISELINQREQIDHSLADAVQAARNAGSTWAEIGTLLGVSKQAAQRKYGEPSFS